MKIDSSWIAWPLGAEGSGNPRIDLDLLVSLVGSSVVEWVVDGKQVYVRRLSD